RAFAAAWMRGLAGETSRTHERQSPPGTWWDHFASPALWLRASQIIAAHTARTGHAPAPPIGPRLGMICRPTLSFRASLLASGRTPLAHSAIRMKRSVVTTTTSQRWHESQELTWRRRTDGIEVRSQVPLDDELAAMHSPTRSAASIANDKPPA